MTHRDTGCLDSISPASAHRAAEPALRRRDRTRPRDSYAQRSVTD